MSGGIDFSDSYAPKSYLDSLRIIIALDSSKGCFLIFYDVSNAFKTIVIEYLSKLLLSSPPIPIHTMVQTKIANSFIALFL